jgi:hypothetical protein
MMAQKYNGNSLRKAISLKIAATTTGTAMTMKKL